MVSPRLMMEDEGEKSAVSHASISDRAFMLLAKNESPGGVERTITIGVFYRSSREQPSLRVVGDGTDRRDGSAGYSVFITNQHRGFVHPLRNQEIRVTDTVRCG